MTEERKCFQLRLVFDGETGIDEVTTLANVRGYPSVPFVHTVSSPGSFKDAGATEHQPVYTAFV
jgi:hypothetical protein